MIERGSSCFWVSRINPDLIAGIYHLRRYYHLLVFQAYLNDRAPDEEDPYSFESFVKHRPGKRMVRTRKSRLTIDTVFKTLDKELEDGGLQGLTPIERMEPAAGMAVCWLIPMMVMIAPYIAERSPIAAR